MHTTEYQTYTAGFLSSCLIFYSWMLCLGRERKALCSKQIIFNLLLKLIISKYSPMLCCKRCLTQSKSIFKPELREQNYDGLDILMTNGFTYQTIPSLKYFHSIIQCNDFHQYHQTRTLIYERDPTFRAESTDHRDRSWHRV